MRIMSSGTFGESENPVIALLVFLYVSGHENSDYWSVLENILDEPTFEITQGEVTYTLEDARDGWKAARAELEADGYTGQSHYREEE